MTFFGVFEVKQKEMLEVKLKELLEAKLMEMLAINLEAKPQSIIPREPGTRFLGRQGPC